MAYLVEVCESNGAGETVTHAVTNLNYGASDAANLARASSTVPPGTHSYEKWWRIHLSDIGTAGVDLITTLKNIKGWAIRTASYATGMTHKTNMRESSYGGAPTYATPVQTASAVATQTFPIDYPAGPNLGIGGSLAGTRTTVGYSDYCVSQVQTTGATPDGDEFWYIFFEWEVVQ